MIKVRVYAWNTNGTNDIEIVDTRSLKTLETIPEALFGIDTGIHDSKLISLKNSLKYVAVSPVNNGDDTESKLKAYIR